MIYLSATYKVKDFKQWHKSFVENESRRIHAGLRVENILREKEDPNQLTILMSVESMTAAEDYLENVLSEESLKNLSVNGKVEVKFFNVFY